MPENWYLIIAVILATGTGCAGSASQVRRHDASSERRASHLASSITRGHSAIDEENATKSTSHVDHPDWVDTDSKAQPTEAGAGQRIQRTAQRVTQIPTQPSAAESDASLFEPEPDPQVVQLAATQATPETPESPSDVKQPTSESTENGAAEPSNDDPHAPDASIKLSKETFPIDLVSVIRLANSNSPVVGYSAARVLEAQARADAANLQWLPNIAAGVTYNRFDGQTQNQRGEIFSVSRSNLFANGAVALSLDVSEAIYRPLIEQRLANAEQQRADAITLATELEAIVAYLELSQVHGLLEINAQTLAKGEAMLIAARNAQRAKLDRSAGDVNRVQTEVFLRKQERMDLKGRAGAASARLAKLLLLNPSVWLVPQNTELVPITLVNAELSLDEMVSIATQNRSDLAASNEILSAAWDRVTKAQRGPLLPKLLVQDSGGTFGGGTNATISDFAGRNSITALMYWELKNLGFGNRLEVRERQAGVDQASFLLAETQARVSSEVVEAAQTAAAKYQSLTLAEQAVKEATELYRINQEGTFNVVDAKNLFDALRPLQALQVLHQARQNYLASVVDYTRAQYRLYTALGCPHSVAASRP